MRNNLIIITTTKYYKVEGNQHQNMKKEIGYKKFNDYLNSLSQVISFPFFGNYMLL